MPNCAEATTRGTVPGSDTAPPPSQGLDTVRRTQRLLRRRALLAGLSVFFSTSPLVLVDRPWGLAGRLGEVVCLLVAAAGWSLFLQNASRLHAAGLEGPRSSLPRIAWYFATALFATSILFSVQDWTGLDLSHWIIAMVMLFWILVLWLGRRLGQLRAPFEIAEAESQLATARDPDASL
jgi:hypothetical protein